MFGLPQELVIVVVFGAVLLIRLLYRGMRRKAASMQARVEQLVRAEPAPAAAAAKAAATRVIAQPRSPRTPRSAPPAAAKPDAPLSPRRARRYTRAELMPDRRALQDAIVIAAILQPCHAQRARDVD